MTSGNRAPREPGSWNAPGAPSASATGYAPAGYAGPPGAGGHPAPAGYRTDRVPGRGRPGAVALAVALLELVVIAVVGNQAVVKHTVRYAGDHGTTFAGQAAGSVSQVAWRFSPQRGDNRGGFHILYSQLTTIAVVVLLSAALAAVATRGPVTFWRALLGIWTGVIAAMCVARVVGQLVTKSYYPVHNRATAAVFAALNGGTVLVGVVLGLVAALVGALVAVSTRRPVAAPLAAAPGPSEPEHVPEAPPPFYGNGPSPDPYGRYQPDDRQPYDPRAEQQTTALPSLSKQDSAATQDAGSTQQLRPAGGGPAGGERASNNPAGNDPAGNAPPQEPDNRTTQIPRFDPRGGQHWTPPEGDPQSTQALPTPPEDERR